MGTKLFLFFALNFVAQIFASPASDGWNWEEVDPYFSTTEKPSTTLRPTSTTGNQNPSTTSIPNPSTTSSPNPSTTSLPIPSTTPSRTYRKCVKRCPSLSTYDPVCGTDNMNYDHESKLYCAKKCGRMVDKLHDGICTPPVTSTMTTTSATQSFGTLNSSCFKRCPKTTEYNPVCGTNNVTYDNPSRFKCAQMCGINAEIRNNGPCSSKPQPTTIRPATTKATTLPPNFRACIRQCIVSNDYKPVCASDGSTYNNESEIMCDISCGRKVEMVRNGPC
ncbi:agrin-like [Tribolium madens]|uniref:agrin-like n=1 Tax=Tribolium madens TaxID=41895 RepID=UPI001CF71EA6|nr:agrin-like [Tribolium madens]